MIVRQQIERHRGNLFQQFVERRCIGGGRDIVAMPAPDRRLLIPGGGNRENDRSGHCLSVSCRSVPQSLRGKRIIKSAPKNTLARASGSEHLMVERRLERRVGAGRSAGIPIENMEPKETTEGIPCLSGG